MPISSLPLQHALFFFPYLNIAWVGGFLLATAKDNVVAALLGLQMISFLCLYLVGYMGNHYVKVYCMLSNMVYMLIFLLFLFYGLFWSGVSATDTFWNFRIPQLLLLWWLPTIANLTYLLVVPSISEILPGRLFLGNLAAASAPELLEEVKITHILELHDGSKKNDPSKVKPELQQLCCSDHLGSEESLIKVAPRAIEYMDKVLSDPKNRLLVHCAAGASRSPAMVVHYLCVSGKESSVADAVRTVRRGRPFVDISSDHLTDIIEHSNEKTMKQKKKEQ